MPWGRCCSLTIKHVTGPVGLTTDTNPDGSTTVHIHTWEPDTVSTAASSESVVTDSTSDASATEPEPEANPSHVAEGGFQPIQGETAAELSSTTHSPADVPFGSSVASPPTTVTEPAPESPPPFDPNSLPPLAA